MLISNCSEVHLQPLGSKGSIQSPGNKTNVEDWSLDTNLLKTILPREQSKLGLPIYSVKVTKDFQLIIKAIALKGKSVSYSKVEHLSCL